MEVSLLPESASTDYTAACVAQCQFLGQPDLRLFLTRIIETGTYEVALMRSFTAAAQKNKYAENGELLVAVTFQTLKQARLVYENIQQCSRFYITNDEK